MTDGVGEPIRFPARIGGLGEGWPDRSAWRVAGGTDEDLPPSKTRDPSETEGKSALGVVYDPFGSGEGLTPGTRA